MNCPNCGSHRIASRRAESSSAGEQAFHPKPEEQQPDALKVEDGVVKATRHQMGEAGRVGQKEGEWEWLGAMTTPGGRCWKHHCPGGPGLAQGYSVCDKCGEKTPEDEPEFRRRFRPNGARQAKPSKEMPEVAPERPSEKDFAPSVNQQQPDQVALADADAHVKAAQSDAPADAQLGEQVETLVNQHQTQNAPAEQRERGAHVKISRQRVEDAILSGSTVEIGSYRLRIASPGGRDQVELRGPDVPPMAWPIRKLTAAVEYFAETCEDAVRTGQAMVPSRVNEQQPDQVQVPADLGPESSSDEPDQMTPAVKEQHDGLDQSGTSKSDFEGTATDDQNVAWSDVTPIQQGWRQPGTSDSLDPEPNPLGQHSSDQEYPGLAPTVEPSSKRADIRAALKGGFGR